MLIIKTVNLKRVYIMGDEKLYALNGVNLEIEKGEFVAIMGASGSGKSTLMNILGCLDRPTEGEYYLDGILVNKLSKNERAVLRSEKIGFVFQGFNLLPRTTALENVELPLLYNRKYHHKNTKEIAKKTLIKVGLESRMYHQPSQLSGGQQQRVAIARALVNNPSIIFADEPTGNLDSKMSVEIMKLFRQLHREGITIVLVTHEWDVASFADRIIEIKDGNIIKDELIDRVKHPLPQGVLE